MAQGLEDLLAAFAEAHSLIPSIHVRWHKTKSNISSRESEAFSSTCVYMHIRTQKTHGLKNPFFLNWVKCCNLVVLATCLLETRM